MLVGFFLCNFLFFYFIPTKKKIDFLCLIHPILYVLVSLAHFSFFTLQNILCNQREEKKITKEIPTLIDFLRSYLMAGMVLPQMFPYVLAQRNWCEPIKQSLFLICQEQNKGLRFQDCLQKGIEFCKNTPSRQYLCLLFSSLKAGLSSGDNIGTIIEKVKYKTQDRIHLERKLKMMTAQMRMQSLVILLAPLGLSILIYLISPNYILFFFENPVGRFLLFIMIILNSLCAYFLRKILTIKG